MEVVGSLPADSYIAKVTQGDRVATRDPFMIRADAGPVHVLLRRDGAKIHGKAAISGNPPRPAYIVLAPKERDATLYYKSMVTAFDGSFALQGIAPGDYTLFAFDRQEHYDGEATLAQYAAAGTAVTVAVGQELAVDLKVIQVEVNK
jgi:hypothetical protein